MGQIPGHGKVRLAARLRLFLSRAITRLDKGWDRSAKLRDALSAINLTANHQQNYLVSECR